MKKLIRFLVQERSLVAWLMAVVTVGNYTTSIFNIVKNVSFVFLMTTPFDWNLTPKKEGWQILHSKWVKSNFRTANSKVIVRHLYGAEKDLQFTWREIFFEFLRERHLIASYATSCSMCFQQTMTQALNDADIYVKPWKKAILTGVSSDDYNNIAYDDNTWCDVVKEWDKVCSTLEVPLKWTK